MSAELRFFFFPDLLQTVKEISHVAGVNAKL